METQDFRTINIQPFLMETLITKMLQTKSILIRVTVTQILVL